MRKLFSFNGVSLDGFFEGLQGDMSWHNVDAEFNTFAQEQLSTIGTLLFGRVTYQLMAGYWPTPAGIADDPGIAATMNSLPKVVISTTLEAAEWNNTTLIRQNVVEELTKLKHAPGGDIAVFDSGRTLTALSNLGLVDEHRVMVMPVVLGAGRPLFEGLSRQALTLVGCRAFDSGNVLLTYQPK